MRYVLLLILITFSALFATEIAISVASGGQTTPSVASDGNKYLVIWEDTRAGTGNPNIFGRFVSGDATLPGFETPIQSIAGYQRIPAVSFAENLFIGTWMDQVSGYAVHGKTIDTTGVPSIMAFNIAAAGGLIQNISMSRNGGAVLTAWEERVSGISKTRASVVREAETSTTPVDLSTSITHQKSPNSAPYSGGWVIVFEDSVASGKGIYGVKVTTAGALDGSPYLIAGGNNASNPAIASHGGGFLVVYGRDNGAFGRDIFGIMLSSTGSPSGGHFPICTQMGDQTRPDIAFDGVGFLVVWQDTRDVFGDIYGQRITTTGTLAGDEFIICDSTGTQQKPKVASNGANLLVVWEDNRSATTDVYGAIVPQMPASSWPEVTIIEPLPLRITACSRNPIKLLVTDPDGIDPYTALVTLRADTFTYYSPALMMVGDTLRLVPATDFPSGDSIRVCLRDIADSLGNHIPDPVCWVFFADLDPPVPSNERPRSGQIIDSFPEYISINLVDSISGVCAGLISFVLDADTFEAGSDEITFDGSTARLYPPAPADTIGTHTVKVFAGDLPDYCAPNILEYSWDFFVNPGGGPNVSAIEPKNGDVTSNPLQPVKIKIKDSDGVDHTSIQLSHAGTVYNWSDGVMSFTDTILTFTPPSPSAHAANVNIMLIRALDMLGINIESPLSYSFRVDTEPPLFLGTWPGHMDTLRLGTDDIKVRAQDSPAGIIGNNDHARFFFYNLSDVLLETSSTGVTQRGDTIVFQSGAFGGSLADNSPVVICARLYDNVDIGTSNSDSTCWRVQIMHIGIDEAGKPENIALSAHPNPFNSSVRIYGAGAEKIEIFDISGRKVWTSTTTALADGHLWRPDADLPAGLYLVKTADNKRTLNILFVK